jgi:hypothetical protein
MLPRNRAAAAAWSLQTVYDLAAKRRVGLRFDCKNLTSKCASLRFTCNRHQKQEQERLEAERRQKQEQERLEAERRQKAEQERLEAERRQKAEQERLEAERQAQKGPARPARPAWLKWLEWLEWLEADLTSAWPITAVAFSVFAPPVIIPYQRFLLYLWAHLPGQLEQIAAQMAELGGTKRVGFRTGVAVASGTLLGVRIDVPGFRIPDPIDRIMWRGKIANATFIIETPSDLQPGEHPGCATISASGIPIAKVCFTLNLESTKFKPTTMLHRLDARKTDCALCFCLVCEA